MCIRDRCSVAYVAVKVVDGQGGGESLPRQASVWTLELFFDCVLLILPITKDVNNLTLLPTYVVGIESYFSNEISC